MIVKLRVSKDNSRSSQ